MKYEQKVSYMVSDLEPNRKLIKNGRDIETFTAIVLCFPKYKLGDRFGFVVFGNDLGVRKQ